MKKKNKHIIRISAIATLSLAIGSGYFLALNNKSAKKAECYSTSSLPTTIDLNDTSAENIRSYYSSLNNLSTSERQGTNLLKNLKTILKNGQKYYSYDSGNAIWQIYEIADRDWDKSPASSTTYGTYNSSTNKITGYTYGTSSSSSKNNPYIHALYINRNVTNQTTAWDDHQQTQWGINREHVWPKAEGFETSGAGGARGDPFHLMAGNGHANNIHSNYYYGYVNTSSSYTNCGSKYSNLSGNLLGKSKTLGGSTNVFEPQDCDKGDIARAIFYMVARYNYLSGSDSDGIDSNNPNLTLTQSLSDWANSGYSSTTSNPGKMGILTDLLNWHHQDPVDQYEIHRNNLLYTNYTNNRNPFIDFPEWADFIWGTATYNGTTYQSYNSNPTGYATPSGDTINGYNSAVGITSISEKNLSIVKGNTKKIYAISSNGGTISWSSSNTSVATVSPSTTASNVNTTITARAAGNTKIKASITIGGKNYDAECDVTVTNTKVLDRITVSGQTTSYNLDGTFSFDGTCIAYFNDETSSEVTPTSVTTPDMSVAGDKTITVTYTTGGVTKTAEYTITVKATSQEGSVTASGGAMEGWTASGTASGGYGDGSVKFDSTGDKIYKLGIFSGDVSDYMTKLTVTINGKINGSPNESNSYKVEAISGTTDNIVSKASDTKTGADVVTTSYGDAVFTMDSGLSGTTGIRVTYATKGSGNWGVLSISWVAEYSVPSTALLSSISLNTSDAQTEFTVGDTFTYEGLSVTAYYTDGSFDIVAPTSVSSPDMSSVGQKTVTVSYTEGDITREETYTITVDALVPTSITATVSKTYYVGQTISSSDITVKDNYDNDITNFAFANDGYQFTYEDAASGGSLTNKTFTNSITYSELTCSLTVQVQRKAHEDAGAVSDTLDQSFTDITGTSYVSWTGKSAPSSSAVYAGNNAGSKSSIQLRSSTSSGSTVHSGIVSTTSGGKISSVTVVWQADTVDDRTLNVYGKNTAYTDQEDLYSSTASVQGTLLGTIVKGTSTSLTITGDYAYVGVRSNSGAMYLTSITFTYGGEDTATNLANYIMYEDTNNQCNTKYSVAKGYFENLTKTERTSFMTSSDYVIATARERLEAWARNKGESISLTNGDYVIATNNGIRLINNDNTYIIALAISMISLIGFGGYFFFRFKKKED